MIDTVDSDVSQSFGDCIQSLSNSAVTLTNRCQHSNDFHSNSNAQDFTNKVNKYKKGLLQEMGVIQNVYHVKYY